jgi:HEAT repeat protein
LLLVHAARGRARGIPMFLLLSVALALSLAAAYSSTAPEPVAASSARSVQDLVLALKDSDPRIRIESANALAALGPEAAEAVPALMDALKSSAKLPPGNVAFHVSVTRALTRIGKPAIPALVRAIGEREESQARSAAAGALAGMGRGASDAVPDLIRILKGNGDRFNQADRDASRALAGIGKPAVPALIELMKESIPVKTPNVTEALNRGLVLQHAAQALGEIGPGATDAVPALVQALKDVDEEFDRLTIAGALCRVRPRERAALNTLEAGLRHANFQPRQLAAMLLGELGPDAAPVVPSLAKLLSDIDESVRTAAAEALAKIGRDGPSAVPALLRALEDEKPKVRTAAATALGLYAQKPAAVVPALARLLRDRDASVRQAASAALVGFGGEARAAVPALAETLRDESEFARITTSLTLAKIGTASPVEVVAAVAKLLQDSKPAVRRAAVVTLSQCGPAAAPALLDALKDSDGQTRQWAAFALGSLGSLGEAGHTAVPTLVELAKVKDARSRASALEALAKVSPAAGGPAVAACQAALQDPEGMVRKAAADALGRIGPGAKEVLPQLLTATKDADGYVRIAAAQALWRISGKITDAKPVLQKCLTDANREFRLEAARVLLNDPESAGSALSALREGLQDLDLAVRLKAVQMVAVPDGPTRDVVPLLRQALQDPELLDLAIPALGAYGPAARDVAPDLVAILDRPSAIIQNAISRRGEIIIALRKIDAELAAKVSAR